MMSYRTRPPCSVLLLCLLRLCTADEIKLTVNEILRHNKSTWSDSFPQLDVSTVQRFDSQSSCSVCVHVHVTMRAADFNGTLTINYWGLSTSMKRKILIKRLKGQKNDTFKWNDSFLQTRKETKIKRLNLQSIGQQTLWKFVWGCFPGDAGQQVVVFLSTTPERKKTVIVQNICPDPVPKFDLSVDETARSLAITIITGGSINLPASSSDVHARMCYRQESGCTDISPLTTIDTNQFPSVNLTFPYLLPCVCVQVYYTHLDAKRTTVCPFVNNSLDAGNRDMWRSSEVTLYGNLGSSLSWTSPCPADLKPSASLCWNHSSLCTPIVNSTLENSVEKGELTYNVSAVDKHPQMCVQFSFRGSHDVYCPFQSDMSKWEAYVGPGSKVLTVYLTSAVPASFAARLCVLEERGCASRGDIYFVNMQFEGATETQLNLPVFIQTEGLCVQVWRSDVAQCGRRILCFDYSHRRRGLLAISALTVLVTLVMLGSVLHYVIKKGVTGWLSIQRPVLLVCSSEQSEHVTAVCTLASILHAELGADVRMALWTQSSIGSSAGNVGSSGLGVAQLGPVPWLYGQWEAVREAGGRVLIIWSPEVKKSYRKWREEREGSKTTGEGTQRGESEGEHLEGLEEIGVEPEQAELKRGEKCEEDHWELSSVTWPVFRAAMSCLQGALQMGGSGHGFALVYFQGLCHRRDIPKDLRSVPRYSLPRDFGGLIQELGGLAGQRSGCWRRLLSKTLSLWLARRLAHRLNLPRTKPEK
ncbi:hypothetical protein UPYG_G00014210 [Umbra pygmaea]|uniref:Uncharacterized protein n=1 Tax=Umbra pygmaea TaxID=75934 RepID=A0ABD0XLY3_UMBPY